MILPVVGAAVMPLMGTMTTPVNANPCVASIRPSNDSTTPRRRQQLQQQSPSSPSSHSKLKAHAVRLLSGLPEDSRLISLREFSRLFEKRFRRRLLAEDIAVLEDVVEMVVVERGAVGGGVDESNNEGVGRVDAALRANDVDGAEEAGAVGGDAVAACAGDGAVEGAVGGGIDIADTRPDMDEVFVQLKAMEPPTLTTRQRRNRHKNVGLRCGFIIQLSKRG